MYQTYLIEHVPDIPESMWQTYLIEYAEYCLSPPYAESFLRHQTQVAQKHPHRNTTPTTIPGVVSGCYLNMIYNTTPTHHYCQGLVVDQGLHLHLALHVHYAGVVPLLAVCPDIFVQKVKLNIKLQSASKVRTQFQWFKFMLVTMKIKSFQINTL